MYLFDFMTTLTDDERREYERNLNGLYKSGKLIPSEYIKANRVARKKLIAKYRSKSKQLKETEQILDYIVRELNWRVIRSSSRCDDYADTDWAKSDFCEEMLANIAQRIEDMKGMVD